ncbi:hypothetical protein [Streptomyces sp. NPDC002851]
MNHGIARLFEVLLLPATGRHRSENSSPATPHVAPPTAHVPLAASVLRGEDTRLVRPYLVAHEREEARRQRARRRALWLSAYGIDAGPRHIHGVEVTA